MMAYPQLSTIEPSGSGVIEGARVLVGVVTTVGGRMAGLKVDVPVGTIGTTAGRGRRLESTKFKLNTSAISARTPITVLTKVDNLMRIISRPRRMSTPPVRLFMG
jgi:hypothetical protein